MRTSPPNRSVAAVCCVTVVALAGWLIPGQMLATVSYVDVNSASPAPPYTNWATAAVTIQAAIDAAVAGDEIVVTNGVYATGGRAVGTNVLVNRVAVTKPLTVRSVNGPEFTVIQGRQVPGTTNGDGAIRCVYLASGAILSGFTLTNGATRMEGDYPAYRESGGGGVWCASTSAVVSNCVLVRNSAYTIGGGAYSGTLNNCTLNGNYSAGSGGGAYSGTLNHCTLKRNAAAGVGGGAYEGTLNNCMLTGNSAGSGGGTFLGTLNNCTLTGNFARQSGGGAESGTLNNCIVYFNTAPQGANHLYGSLSYCCTVPFPENGNHNLTLDPQLSSASHISAGSPCRGAGQAALARGTDIDGEAWANPPAIGCDEYHAGSVAGPLSVGIGASFTSVAPGFPVNLTALIAGRPTASVWDFGDGMAATNQPYTTHAWTTPGDYVVVLSAFNDSHPQGVSATLTVHIHPAVYYVSAGNANPLPPYTSWATAATNIQAAVDAAAVGGLVLVSNGVYATGARAAFGPNRVAVTRPLTVRSVNGPEHTVVDGGRSVRCVYLTNGVTFAGFTLTNGVADSGGGVRAESGSAVVSNCVVTGNSAGSGGGVSGGTLNNCVLQGNAADAAGGGAYSGTLNNCTLTGNSAKFQGGGGADYCTLNNCVLTGNSAYYGGGVSWSDLNNCTITGNRATSPYFGEGGGGAYYSTLRNCIVYFNTAQTGANHLECSLSHCCTTPLPTYGTGNIALNPQLASASHLSAASPCRGAGSAEYVIGTDLDNEAWTDPPSIGCDEFQAGPATGPLSVSIATSFTNVAAGFIVRFTGNILGQAASNVWDFGDGTIVLSEVFQPFAAHSWTTPGTYPVVLRAFNQTHHDGISATVTVHVVATPVHYVSAASADPIAPYTSWATAARTIQAAVDAFGAGTVPGALVLVTNGIYATGGSVGGDGDWSRVVVGNPLTLRSVSGPHLTMIDGVGTGRCVYLTSDASLSGFTLTNGFANSGGGLFCESASATVSNCVLVNNWAYEGGGAYGGTLHHCLFTANVSDGRGGGAYGSTLNHCTVEGNRAEYYGGGGASDSTLNSCTLIGNSANEGGGVARSTLFNCALTGNSAWDRGGGAYLGTLNNCVLSGNTASLGGGASGDPGCRYDCPSIPVILNNCSVTGNSAEYSGGGVTLGTLNNCTVTGNSATRSGGGVVWGSLTNCIVYFNSAPSGANHSGGGLDYCCTTPQPEPWRGTGNITNAPAFLNPAVGDFHLRHDSPCIDAGTNLSALFTHDLDGNLRPLDGNGDGVAFFDIGAYEFDRRSCTPVLTVQPQSQTINEGSIATFTVAADGLTPFLYQWRFNGADIAAATNASLTLTGVQTIQAGSYSVRVTNDCGDVVSSNALLRVNRPPVADAGATPTPVISANGLDARVGLDASRSSDPDNDPLEYRWFSTLNVQPSTLLATGMVAVVTLPVGMMPVQLVVSDGLATSTNTITVTVLTTGQGVQRLIALVNSSNLQQPCPLVATLEAALASIERRDLVAAANQLRAFQNKVRAQVAPENPSLADALLAAAQQLIDALGDRSGGPGGRIQLVQHQPGGKMRLKFTGPAGGVHVVQASINLLDWETIGVAVDHGDGQFEFEDAQASRFPNRYYRLVSR